MAQQIKSFLSVLGIVTWGDLGPLTIYRNKRGRMVAYPKAPPTCPASPIQTLYRDKWRDAAIAWNNLAEDVRARWELATHRASLRITGYNLWVFYHTTGDEPVIRTLEQITGLALLPP